MNPSDFIGVGIFLLFYLGIMIGIRELVRRSNARQQKKFESQLRLRFATAHSLNFAINAMRVTAAPYMYVLDSYYHEEYHWCSVESAAEMLSLVYERAGRPQGQGFEYMLALYAPHKLVDMCNAQICNTIHFLNLANNGAIADQIRPS